MTKAKAASAKPAAEPAGNAVEVLVSDKNKAADIAREALKAIIVESKPKMDELGRFRAYRPDAWVMAEIAKRAIEEMDRV
jgi:hypothetical protein